MTQLIESVLGGGGQMGELMRAVDWSTTALGPLEQWPQSLRICVQIILGSGYPMAICWGPDYTLLYNDAQRVLFGTKHPAALGRSTREMFSEAWDSVGPLYDRVLREGQAYATLADQLFPLNRYNYLEECYFSLSYSPIPDGSGHVGGVFVTGIDTTERVIEDRRRQVLRDVASRTAEARYEDEVWRVSADTLGEHRLAVPFAFLYACRPTEREAYLVGPSAEPDALDPSVIDCTSQNLWGFDTALPGEGIVVELGQRASLLPSISWPMPPEKAAVVPIRLREQSDAAGFLVLGIHPGRAFDDTYRQFVRRIAEQIAIGLASARAYELQLQRADALAEIDRAKTAFFSNVSHEFRTPLQLMLGPLEEVLPEAGERLGPERYQQLLTARRNALRLLKLVNTLLDFSRLEAGRVQAVYQPTDLAALTSDIASMFRSAIDGAGLQFSVECEHIADAVFVDRGMWEKVVLNLLSNAFKFTFEGEVAISLKLVDGAVELQVRDTGVGIPDDQREKVFERFHRIERTSARTHEGTGIGLALVQELVTLHGGSVGVKSAVGVGSTFTVTIPRGTEHLPAESIRAEQSPASSAIRAEAYVEEALRWVPDASSGPVDVPMPAKLSSLGSSREAVLGSEREVIVLADDNADMREYLTRLLGDRYDVRAVADGHQALEVARQVRPALLLADVMMPQLNGFGLLRAIREDAALCSTPVILVSARAGEESRVEGLQADADDYLVKPFTSRELLARVATHVKMADLRRVTAEREERLRNEAELQRQKLQASQELLAETSRLYRDLAERERESRMIVNSIPGLVATLTPSGQVEAVTEQVIAYCGQTLEELTQWGMNDTVHPDDLPRVIESLSNSITSGEPYEIVHRIRRLDGVYRWFQVRGLPLRGSNGSIVRWYVLLTDIDDLKCAEALLDGEKRLLEMVASGRPLEDVLETMCDFVDTVVSHCACSILLVDSNGTFRHGAGPALPAGYDGTVNGAPVVCEAGPCGTAASLNEQVIVPDLVSDERWLGLAWRTLVLAQGLRSVCSTPIVSSTGKVLGTFAIYQREPGAPTALLTDLIARFTNVASIAIERAINYHDLQQRERESRLIVDSIPGLVATLTPAGEVEAVNEQVLAYCGQTLEELKHWATNDTIHPDDLPRVIDVMSDSMKSGDPFEIVERIRRFDGVYRWFQIRGLPLRDVGSQIVRWYVLLSDIDDRKRAEEALRHSERQFRLLVETIPALVWRGTSEGELDFLNERAVEYLGLTVESLTGERWLQLVHPDHRDATVRRWLLSITTGSSYDDVYRLRRADGEYRWIQSVGEPFHDTEGRITHWYGLVIDIEDRKRAETELRALKDQLYQENLVLRDEVDRTSMFEEIVGTSKPLHAVLSRLSKVAPTDSTVLITGETGTGKELVARAIHRRSARGPRPFVSVNCAAVPRELIASELFGHEKGAFTGATQRRLGRFELAHGGTIFLDEVGELPMETQVALLRVLQEREFERVGGSTSIRIDVRVIAATNRELQAPIEAGTFRSDLFYRLNVFPIAVPALRERADDIPLLVEYFIDRYARKAGKTIRRVNKRTLDHLRAYPWPGNVRELQNVIERSVIVCDTNEFTVDDSWLSARPAIENPLALSGTLAAHEKAIIEDALRTCGGRVYGPAGAATRLGMPRSTLESKIRALRINKSRFRSRPKS